MTNVRNVESDHWRRWLEPEYRCLVPATAFSEYTDSLPKFVNWFARSQSRETFSFAGIWRPWNGKRGTSAERIEGDHLLFGFLTTEPNTIVSPIHAKAIPVILTEDQWLTADTPGALAMQRPAADELIQIVATGEKRDPPESRMGAP